MKARLDARKSAPPSASLVAPEESKFYKTQSSENNQGASNVDAQSTSLFARQEELSAPVMIQQDDAQSSKKKLLQKGIESIVIQNDSLLKSNAEDSAPTVKRDEFMELKSQVNEIKDILLANMRNQQQPQFGSEISPVKAGFLNTHSGYRAYDMLSQ